MLRTNMLLIISMLSVILFFSSCMDEKSPTRTEDLVGVFSVRYVFNAAKNVYIGKLLSAEPSGDYPGDDSLPTLKIKVEIQEVMKGGFKSKEIVEDIFIGTHFLYEPNKKGLHYKGILEVGEDYLFMTGEDSSFYYDSYTAHHIMNNSYYNAIRLLENGEIELYFVNELPDNHIGFNGENPPCNYGDLLRQLAETLPDVHVPTGNSQYNCPCEYPDALVKEWLSDSYRDPNDLYCEIHEIDNADR